MNTNDQYRDTNGEATSHDHRSADEIERDIRATQDDMSRTVNRLGDQFTLRNLVNGLLDKAEANDFEARTLYDGARRNPLALGLISAGAIWLVSDNDAKLPKFGSSSNGHDRESGTLMLGDGHEREHRAYLEHMNRIERRADEDHDSYQRRRDDARANYLMIERRHEEDDKSFRDRLEEATESMRRKRHEMVENARARGSSAMSKAREAGSSISDRSQRTADQASHIYEENPLIGGALAALVGLIAGSAAPATNAERRFMGEHAEGSLEFAKHKAQGLADKAHDMKDDAIEKVEHMADPDHSGSDTVRGSGRSHDNTVIHRQV